MIINAAHICKSFGEDLIIRDASFFVNEKEKVAIVGANGAGKTTLLRMLSGESKADSGEIVLAKDATLGFLHQMNDIDSTRTILDEMYDVIRHILDMEARMQELSEEMKHHSDEGLEQYLEEYHQLTQRFELSEGYQIKSKVVGILKGLGFTEHEFDREISTLSGGQKTRVFLGKLLLSEPDIILLDEPTNHLDLSSIEWLEGYLNAYKGAVVIVSHDRYFLDKIVTRVIDIEQGEVSVYSGNYSAFTQKKSFAREAKRKAYQNQQAQIRHQEAVIEKLRSFNREKSIKRAESREKLLDKIERLDKPTELKTDMNLHFQPAFESGSDVLTVENLSKAYDKPLFSDLSFEIKRGEHVAIMGDNGTGKTTILKIINGLVEADAGSVRLGAKVAIAFYDQEHQILHMEKTLFDELSDTYPDLNNTRIRNVLAAFLFTGDDVYKRIGDLSGGERGRVSLAKLMLSHANFLILDEPTNHLDMMSKEVLENAIREFQGTVLYVSHDRYFINRTATRILDLRHTCLMDYIGNYDYYLEKKKDVEHYTMNVLGAKPKEEMQKAVSSKEEWRSNKEEQARIKKLQNALKSCENTIHEFEEKIAAIDAQFSVEENQTDVAKLTALSKEKAKLEEELSGLYEEWEDLAQSLEGE